MSMAIAPTAAPTAPPVHEPGYIESALHWLIEKVNAVVYWIISYFCSAQASALPPPAGVVVAPTAPAPAPPSIDPAAAFAALPEGDRRARCKNVMDLLWQNSLPGIQETVGRAVYKKGLNLDRFHSYQEIGKRALENDPLLLYAHVPSLREALYN